MIDPSIALSGKPVQFDGDKIVNLIAQGQQRRMAQESHAQQMQAGAQNLQAGALDLSEKQRQIAQSKAMDAAYQGALTVGADGTPTIDKGKLTSALSQGGHGSAIPGVLKNMTDFEKSTADLSKLNSEVAEKQADYGGIVGATAASANYDPNLFITKAQHAMDSKALPAQIVQPYIQQVTQLMQQDPTGESARALVKQISDHLIAGSPAQQKLMTEAKTAAAHAQTAQTGADKFAVEKPGLVAEAAVKQFELDAAKATPEQQAAKVGATIDQTKYPEIYKRTLANVTAGVTHQEKMSALHAGSAEVAEREKETDPAIRSARVATAVATENALTPGMVQRAVDTEVAKAKQAPESFNAIVDPRARAAAEADYAKDSKEYADKVSEARRLKGLIVAAQNGNKAAPGVIPIEELRSFVNRVNSQELKRVSSGAGDAYDRVQGFISGYTKGQPIPAAILKDTAELADLNEKAARTGYEFKVQINNKTHGGNVKPINFAQPVDEDKLKSYADDHFGGDIEKARAAVAAQRAK